jgi:beta-glucosidase
MQSHILISFWQARNPKGGRNWESFGPEPYLAGEGAYETIVGVQSAGVQACAKHYAANNQEHSRFNISSELDDRTLAEMYAYPYVRAIEVGLLFAALGEVDGLLNCVVGERILYHVLV